MNNTIILDCTLRDGGYYTNWDFDKDLVREYYQAMEALPIDYVEIGYRTKALEGYYGKFFYCPDYVMAEAKQFMPSKKLSIILNEKDVRANDVDELLDPCKPYIALIRIAVAPENIKRAIELAKAIKAKGFEVAFNVMYMSKWAQNTDFMASIKDVDGVVDYFYLVDSYGGVHPSEVKSLMETVKNETSTPLGFHGHNNLEMALINTLTAAEAGARILDCTITGMGRGAGNLKTELLLTYLAHQGKKVSFTALSRVVTSFENLQNQYRWGTNLPYMFSGANSLPQKEVMEWVGLNRYPMGTIVNALSNKKNELSDNIKLPVFSPEKKYKKALIIGGGPSVLDHEQAVKNLIENNESHEFCVIHAGVRYLKHFHALSKDQMYCMVGSEKDKLERRFEDLTQLDMPCIFSPYPRKMGTFLPKDIEDHAVELGTISFIEQHSDSLLAIAIQTAMDLGVEEAYLIGYDGYDSKLSQSQFTVAKENQNIIDAANRLNNFKLIACTNTKYTNLTQSSIYSLTQNL